MTTARIRRHAWLCVATVLAAGVPARADHDRLRLPDADLEDLDASATRLGQILAVDVRFELEVDDWYGSDLLLVLQPLEDDYELTDAYGEPVEFVYDVTPRYRDDDDFEIERRIHFDLTLGEGIDPYDLRLLGLVVDAATGRVLDDKTARISVHRPRVYRSRCDVIATPRVPILSSGVRHSTVVHHRRVIHRRRVVQHRRVIHTRRPAIGIRGVRTSPHHPARTGPGVLRHAGRTIELRRHHSVQQRRSATRRSVKVRIHR